ncbi:LON peptidase substrate-binding domain-containing protein [Microlunatus panaciterrae]
MFPLGSVLFPYMPLQLRVFEERYLIMLKELLSSDSAEFGVVLIERGQEVGGGEQRFDTGTIAQVVELAADEGVVQLAAQGEHRIQVLDWLPEEPFPRAEVRPLPDLVWDSELHSQLDRTEGVVRRALALASEFDQTQWWADIELADEPLQRCWQLAGIAPLGPLDQLALLRSTSTEQLLVTLARLSREATEAWAAPWGSNEDS